MTIKETSEKIKAILAATPYTREEIALFREAEVKKVYSPRPARGPGSRSKGAWNVCSKCDKLCREVSPKKGKCELCGEPMPKGEESFRYHGYSGDCPKPPLKHSNPPEPSWEEAWRKNVNTACPCCGGGIEGHSKGGMLDKIIAQENNIALQAYRKELREKIENIRVFIPQLPNEGPINWTKSGQEIIKEILALLNETPPK